MWNAPNIVTLGRLCLLPVIVILIWPGIENRTNCFWAAVLYGIGGLLDIVDGVIARRWNLVTVFGKFFDPLADKLFLLVTMVALLQLPGPRIPAWIVIVFLIRELSITGLRAIAVSDGVVIAAGHEGKVKTTFSIVGGVCLLLHYPYLIDYGFFVHRVDFHVLGLWVTYISVAFALVSALGYVRGFLRALREKKKSLQG